MPPVDKTMGSIARIWADRESLDQLEGLCSHATLASQITVLVVDLCCRSELLANNLPEFQKYFEERLSHLQKEADAPHEHSAVENYKKIYRESEPVDSSKILVNCHEKYKAAYKAQKELLESGEFMRNLQRLFEQLPNLTGLCFMGDDYFGPCTISQISANSVRLLSRNCFSLETADGIEQFLVRSHEFYELEKKFKADDEVVETTRLFIDVPWALHTAGRRLTSLEIYYLPRGAYMPREEDPTEAMWDGIAQVFKSSLERFILNTEDYHSTPEVSSLYALSHRHTRRLVRSVLSSEELQSISISLAKLPCAKVAGEEIDDPFPLETLLPDSPSWPKIQRLELGSCRLPAENMERICDGTGEELKVLELLSIYLPEGTWDKISDILRGKLKRAVSNREDQIDLDDLRYGDDEDQDTDLMKMSLKGWFRRPT